MWILTNSVFLLSTTFSLLSAEKYEFEMSEKYDWTILKNVKFLQTVSRRYLQIGTEENIKFRKGERMDANRIFQFRNRRIIIFIRSRLEEKLKLYCVYDRLDGKS